MIGDNPSGDEVLAGFQKLRGRSKLPTWSARNGGVVRVKCSPFVFRDTADLTGKICDARARSFSLLSHSPAFFAPGEDAAGYCEGGVCGWDATVDGSLKKHFFDLVLCEAVP